MRIHDEVFQRMSLLPERLLPFGFVCEGGGYVYRCAILDGQMTVEVSVADGAVCSRVVDAFSGEEYAPVNVDISTGAYVGMVREAYRAVLERVAEACCRQEYFLSRQANRIAAGISSRYGERPDFPFATAPTYGVFRYPPTRKWYALVMDVKRCLVTKEAEADSPIVNVLNVKIDPAVREALLAHRGIYRCYHMNKDGWISVVLDDEVEDELVLQLIDTSRNNIIAKTRKQL